MAAHGEDIACTAVAAHPVYIASPDAEHAILMGCAPACASEFPLVWLLLRLHAALLLIGDHALQAARRCA